MTKAEARSPLRALIVDDDALFRDSTCKLLQRSGCACMAAAGPKQALPLIVEHDYDVVVCDLVMEGDSQLDFVRRVVELPDAPAVVLFTARPSVETAIEALELGVVGYLVKPFPHEELEARIAKATRRRTLDRLDRRARDAVLQARSHLDEAVAELEGVLYDVMRAGPDRPDRAGEERRYRATSAELALLTPREYELVGELAEGYRVSTIARRLKISQNTVRRHLKSIFLKLEVGSQADLLEKLKPWSAR